MKAFIYLSLIFAILLSNFNFITINTLADSNLSNQNLCNESLLCQNQGYNIFASSDVKNKPIPTNRVWSGVTFSGQNQGLFMFPQTVKTENNELKFGVPNYATQVKANSIGGAIGGETFGLTGVGRNVTNSEVVDYSDLTVRIAFKDSNKETLFEANFIQGSPHVFIYPKVKELTIKGGVYEFEKSTNTLNFNQNSYGIYTNSTVNSSNPKNLTINFEKNPNDFLTITRLPKKSDYKLLENSSFNPIDKIFATMDANSSSITTNLNITYSEKARNKVTIWGLLPHQNRLNQTPLFTLNSIRGTQSFYNYGTRINISADKVPLFENLPIDTSSPDIEKLKSALKDDINSLNLNDTEASYEGGKVLAKAARLIQIADSLKNIELRDKAINILKPELEKWYNYTNGKTSKYFQYDSTVGTLIAQKAGYNSDTEINDHHFHYGYHLFAASVVAKYDSAFLSKNKEFIDLIASDFANYNRDSKTFPYLRNYDFFEGHSWASGTVPFGDGNNQESTSEAINAWYAVWLWGRVSNNQNFEKVGQFLYSNEVNSTYYYWLNHTNTPSIFPKPYANSIASIVWGGKVDYATFFSSDILAIHGIQYLPFTAGSTYLYNKQYLQRDALLLKPLVQSRNDDWVDLVSMYLAMNEGKKLFSDTKWQNLPLDNGNSRSNLYSWLNFWDSNQGYLRFSGINYTGALIIKNKSYQIIIDCSVDKATSIGGKNCVRGMNLFDNSDPLEIQKIFKAQNNTTINTETLEVIRGIFNGLKK